MAALGLFQFGSARSRTHHTTSRPLQVDLVRVQVAFGVDQVDVVLFAAAAAALLAPTSDDVLELLHPQLAEIRTGEIQLLGCVLFVPRHMGEGIRVRVSHRHEQNRHGLQQEQFHK